MPNEQRLSHVEERIAWLERHVAEQDRAMMEQSAEVANLRKQLLLLQARVSTSSLQADVGAAESADERPPHY